MFENVKRAMGNSNFICQMELTDEVKKELFILMKGYKLNFTVMDLGSLFGTVIELCETKDSEGLTFEEITSRELDQKELEDAKELDKHLDFSDGALMSGFDYKGQQIVAMPLEEYDKLMEKDEALKVVKEKEVNVRFLKQMLQNEGWVRYETYQDYLRKDCEEFKRAYLSVSLLPLTQEEFDLLKRYLNND